MKKIAVIFGGQSEEKKVSTHTGLSVIEAMKGHYRVIPINLGNDYSKLHEKLFNVDLVFNALHGGYGENGEIQKYLDKFNIKYTGSDSDSSKICMDKNKTKLIAKKINIPVLEWDIINKDKKFNFDKWATPFIIKPNDSGSTIGLELISDKSNINEALRKSFGVSETLMIEKYCKGKEISVPIIDNNILPAIEIKSSNLLYDYESKYESDKTEYIIPANINSKLLRRISDDALKLYKKIRCRHYARIDFLVKANKYYMLEINTLPGLTSTSLLPKSAKYIGLNYKNLIKKIVELSL